MKIDNFYKFVASTFGIAYFTGLVIGVVSSIIGRTNIQNIDYVKLFYLSSSINFREVFVTTFNNALTLGITPFTYLIESVNQGFSHAFLLTAPFLGQIKLLVQFIPQLFFFITYIILSVIGLKLILLIIRKIVNIILEKNNKGIIINLKLFHKDDFFLFYIALLSLAMGVVIQIFLAKIFFIFLINFQLITYIFILVLYFTLIVISLYTVYKTIFSLLKTFKKLKKIIIYK